MAQPMTMAEEEAKWAAENDARTLSEAEAIKADGPRFKKARTAAKRLAKEEKARAKAMADVANAKLDYSKSPKPPK